MIRIFDCDGILIDSNNIKTNSFRELLEFFLIDKKIADLFIEYHKNNGGISRFVKLKYLEKLLIESKKDVSYNQLLFKFSEICRINLLNSKLCEGIEEFICKEKGSINYVASGGQEDEVKFILKKKLISDYFRYIYGSPKPKIEIIKSIISNHPKNKIILFGDSPYDAECAFSTGIECILFYRYSETSFDLLEKASKLYNSKLCYWINE